MKLGTKSAILALLIGVAPPIWADEARDKLIVETILRLESFDYSAASEKVQSAVGRYLEKSKGSDDYFDLVERFEITDQMGALASDGESELGLKVPGGTLVSLKREDIASQTALPVSLMPAGLAATMSQSDLVDLVEYLTTLKKK